MAFKVATVNASDVPSTQTNFPAYVDLSRLGITTLAEAQSVRVYADEAKTTEWAREIVSVDEMHVKIPSLTTTTDIYVDYDGVRADYGVTDTYGRNAVWSDYEFVSHMESTGSSQIDSTGNGGDLGIENGAPTTGATGEIGNAVSFDGNDSYTQTAYALDALTASTVQFIAKRDNTSGTNRGMFNYGDSYQAGNYQQAWELDFVGAGSTFLFYSHYKSQGSGATQRQQIIGTTNLGSGSFVWASATWDGAGQFELYANGSPEASATNANMTSMYNVSPTYDRLYVGRYENQFGDRYFAGDLDELRVRELALSANWIATEYNNQSDEATFWGTWTDAGGGGGPTANNSARRQHLLSM